MSAGGLSPSPARDRTARQRVLARSIGWAVPGTLAAIGLAYLGMPSLAGLETEAGRLALALRWLPVAMLPYAAVCLVMLVQRFREGAHNPLTGTESERLRIHGRVMQNTLEQFVWFAVCLLALAVLLPPQQARIVPVACVVFAVARGVYWHGYLRNGTLGRAPGVQMTFTLNIAMLVHALVLLAMGR